MSWIKKIFKSGKQTEYPSVSKEDEMLAKLDATISNCKMEITKAENESVQLRNWAIDAIRDSFEVPTQFWYEEFKKYQEIRALDENKSIDEQVVQKCDEVVQGYMEEIELREAKVKLYLSLIEKYQASKDKILIIRGRKESDKLAETKLHALEKHSWRLEQLKIDPENLENHIIETNQFDEIKEEVAEVYEEFEINEEVRNYIHKINHQFTTQVAGYNSKAAIGEIEALLEKLSQQK